MGHRPVGAVAQDIAIEAVGLGFDSQTRQIRRYRQQLASAAMFLRICVSLNRGDGFRHSLHASA